MNTLPDLDLTVTESPSVEEPCQGSAHSLGTIGHDAGPARFQISAMCPACGDNDIFNLCEGRTIAVMSEPEKILSCDCGYTGPTDEFWRLITPIGRTPCPR